VLTIDVLGTPAPQGSKKGFYNPKLGRVQIVEDAKQKTRTWRQDVLTAAVDAQPDDWQAIDGPVWVEVCFHFKRPAVDVVCSRHSRASVRSEHRPISDSWIEVVGEFHRVRRVVTIGISGGNDI